MHYYKFNIADWHLATSHLSLEEEAIYFRLINYYYDTENPIPQETQSVIRRLRLGKHSDLVSIVLQEFFTLEDGFWHHKRCDDEISQYHDKAEVNQINGKKGGRPKKTQSVSKDNPDITLTKNHKPLTTNHNIESAKAPKAQRLKIESLPKEWADFCKQERPDLKPESIWNQFRDYWVSVPGQKGCKLDWLATWRNWVRNQKGSSVTIPDKPTVIWHQTLAGVMAKGKELGIEPRAGETEGQYRQRLMQGGA